MKHSASCQRSWKLKYASLSSYCFPLIRPSVFAGCILVFIPALGSYLTPELLGGTDGQLIANVIERQFKHANDWPLVPHFRWF